MKRVQEIINGVQHLNSYFSKRNIFLQLKKLNIWYIINNIDYSNI